MISFSGSKSAPVALMKHPTICVLKRKSMFAISNNIILKNSSKRTSHYKIDLANLVRTLQGSGIIVSKILNGIFSIKWWRKGVSENYYLWWRDILTSHKLIVFSRLKMTKVSRSSLIWTWGFLCSANIIAPLPLKVWIF